MQILVGTKLKNWLKLTGRHFREIPADKLAMALKLTITTYFRNDRYEAKELQAYGDKIRNAVIHPQPVFVLGHWRSGTSHLHQLLSLGKQFTFPTVFDIYSPHSFLYTAPMLEEKMAKAGEQKRPMDQMKIKFNDPGEDEFALAVMSLMSPVLAWVFPKSTAFYDRYLTFEEVDQKEIDYWKEQFLYFMKKLNTRNPKPVILKSPQHTARIKLLREMFPRARFIHVHRNPYDVYNSTVKLYEKTVRPMQMTDSIDANQMREGIIGRYRNMYRNFFTESALLPADQFLDVSYEELDRQPLQLIERIFRHFGFEDYASYKPLLEAHLESIGSYKKNKYSPVAEPWLSRINREWAFAFDKWNYPLNREN
ncbi:MAG TPA: sulfotransferase [Caldithrix abyssi]|uniref:Sulfotransferase n=1 Tax=Caldithrix abyssi TaxID=187145 RepID=A0A7V1LZM0_CALAY|nr:sulfotransferase [Caldithrix abyssi]